MLGGNLITITTLSGSWRRASVYILNVEGESADKIFYTIFKCYKVNKLKNNVNKVPLDDQRGSKEASIDRRRGQFVIPSG